LGRPYSFRNILRTPADWEEYLIYIKLLELEESRLEAESIEAERIGAESIEAERVEAERRAERKARLWHMAEGRQRAELERIHIYGEPERIRIQREHRHEMQRCGDMIDYRNDGGELTESNMTELETYAFRCYLEAYQNSNGN
jgi:hypothetical protein